MQVELVTNRFLKLRLYLDSMKKLLTFTKSPSHLRMSGQLYINLTKNDILLIKYDRFLFSLPKGH